jgi:catechol 2,3-dioxygenase-like lactoylglutathione lyase family enzyme
MGILEAAKPVAIICTRDRTRAAKFYRDTLGLRLKLEDDHAVVFDVSGIDLRVSTVPDFTPHEHTVLGFSVPDVPAAVKALREKGVTFNTYKGFNQDELGIFSLPNSALRVAWFNDPDGNVLSVTNT